MSSQRFNPYVAWFGLPAGTKPSYYELLGVRNFETEPPVIAEAAECRLQLLAPHQSGPHAEAAEKLSREVTGVMNVLLSPEKRRQYDDKLRGQLSGGEAGGASHPASQANADDMLPPSIAAAESPTMMLPPGALPPAAAMPPSAAPAQAGMPPGMPGYGAYPPGAFPPGAMPAGAPPYGAMPSQPYGAPTYAAGMPPQQAAPYGATYSDPAAMQPGNYPPMVAAASFPQSAPMGFGGPAVGPGPGPGSGFAEAVASPSLYQSPLPGAAPAAGPSPGPSATFASSNVSQRTRAAGARRQQSSTMLIALGLLGGGAALLTVVMLAVAASNRTKQTPVVASAPIIARPPAKMSSEDEIRMKNAEAMRNAGLTPRPASPVERLPGAPGTYQSASQEELKRESMVPNAPSGLPSMPDLVMSMAPTGVVPSIATPAPAAPAPTAPTPPVTFDTPPTAPPTPAAMPAATAAAAMPTPPPAIPAAVPFIAGMDAEMPAMTAVLPADAARARSVNTMLGLARKYLRAREYAKAEEIILQTQVLADTPELIESTAEHFRASELLRTFWIAVREGVKSLKEGEELTYDGKTVIVVKHDDANLIVKADNKETVLQIEKLVPGLALHLAQRSLSGDDAASKVTLATFLGLDNSADRAKSAAMFDEAASEGANIANLRVVINSPS